MNQPPRTRPDPPVTPDTGEWWEACRNRRLTVQACQQCDTRQLYPRAICTGCGGTELTLVDASGRGVVYSHTTVHRSPDPEGFPPPYVVALVRLEEGPTLLTNIVGPGALDVACDSAVVLRWEALPDGRNLPLFELAPSQE